MRVVYMGNPSFAVPTLQAIHNSEHQLVAVVCSLDKQSGRGRKITAQPVKDAAAVLGYPVLQPESLRDSQFHTDLRDLRADIFVVLAFRILPDAVLDIPSHGAINLHPSLLPKYRGAAPIHHALLNGDTTTGLSTIVINSRVDSGDLLIQRSVEIDPTDDNGSLSERLSIQGADLVVETLDGLESGHLAPKPQGDVSGLSPAPKITADDTIIDWHRPAQSVMNQIRAFSPKPGASTILDGKRLKLFVASLSDGNGKPGTVLSSGNQLEIATSDGSIICDELQIEGKRRMPVGDFFRGASLPDNLVLGSA